MLVDICDKCGKWLYPSPYFNFHSPVLCGKCKREENDKMIEEYLTAERKKIND